MPEAGTPALKDQPSKGDSHSYGMLGRQKVHEHVSQRREPLPAV